ncbi:MAG: hypothetical protein ACRELT_12710, partial [Longimicrobiales bacterium]
MKSHRVRGAAPALVTAVLLLLAWPGAGIAQQVSSALLPDTVAERLVEFYNMETTTRLSGDARVGPGTVIRGGVAVLGGSLTIEGTVEGDVMVINGDLAVLAGGGVTGSATITGGDATIIDPSSV